MGNKSFCSMLLKQVVLCTVLHKWESCGLVWWCFSQLKHYPWQGTWTEVRSKMKTTPVEPCPKAKALSTLTSLANPFPSSLISQYLYQNFLQQAVLPMTRIGQIVENTYLSASWTMRQYHYNGLPLDVYTDKKSFPVQPYHQSPINVRIAGSQDYPAKHCCSTAWCPLCAQSFTCANCGGSHNRYLALFLLPQCIAQDEQNVPPHHLLHSLLH